jgi:sulfur-oxidizing protein SoxY
MLRLSAQRFGLILACALVASVAQAQDDDAARRARWQDLASSIFGNRTIANGDDKITIEAPARAEDAALVPVTITFKNPADVKGVYFLIDDNPAPLAAHVTFGPAADATKLALRVRVDQYSYMHAVVETQSGELVEASRFIKASGGCSAPAGGYDEAALTDVGEMKARVHAAGSGPREVQLLIRHPNFNGMQMDPVTRLYTPAHYLKSADVTFDGKQVLHLDGDISLSTDPAITFALSGHAKGKLSVTARDSDDRVFQHDFDVAQEGS